jgi:signal transduction histidine kinase
MTRFYQVLLVSSWLACFEGSAAARAVASETNAFPIVIDQFTTDGHPHQIGLKTPAIRPSDTARESSWQAGCEPVRISSHTRQLEFAFGPNAKANRHPVRLRYQLESYEKEWHEIGGAMRLVAHCRDTQAQPIDSVEFSAAGSSPGWTGSLETSVFIERRMTLTVPTRAVELRMWMPSGGNADITGVFIIDNLKITRLAEDGLNQEEVLLSEDFERGTDLDQPLGNFTEWVRGGTALGIAQVVRIGPGHEGHAMAVIDADPEHFGEWQADGSRKIPVKPGWKLLVRFEEMHSVGACYVTTARYDNVPQGNYRFRVMDVSEFGIPRGVEVSVPLSVVPPFYEALWFRLLLLLLVGGLLVGAIRYRMFRQLHLQLRFERATEQERARIARDIHDEIGTCLTRVSYTTAAAKKYLGAQAVHVPQLGQIQAITQEITRALDEIVWAVDPKNDSLESLANYLASVAQDILGLSGIRCRLQFPIPMPNCVLSSELRHHISLACKEALNNIVKHAEATEVHIGLAAGGDRFEISVQDNGKGINPESKERGDSTAGARTGRGLKNMRHRLEKIGGVLEISSSPGKGTCIRLIVPVPGPVRFPMNPGN